MAERGHWHPILAAFETETGKWEMRDDRGQVYGQIHLERGAVKLAYWAQYVDRNGQAVDLRRWRKLAAACKAVHLAYVNSLGPGGPVNGWDKH